MNILVNAAECLEHPGPFFGDEKFKIGIFSVECGQPAGMIRFHMVDNQVVHISGLQRDRGHLLLKLGRFVVHILGQVNNGGFLPLNDVGVDGDTVGHGPHALKKLIVFQVDSQSVDSFRHFGRFHDTLAVVEVMFLSI